MSAEERLLPLLDEAAALDGAELDALLRGLPAPARRGLFELWSWQAHGGQSEPPGNWRVWLMMAGRGFGKTRAGAEWVWARARERPDARIALVAANLDDAVKVMIEGESGLKAAARTGESLRWVASRRRADFSTGASAFAYSAERPDKLRGPQHHHAWCDELGKWARAEATWDNLMLGLRLGTAPRCVITTTPRTIPLIRRIRALERLAETGGRTSENLHLAADFREAVEAVYAGTRLGRQELDGELIDEATGALWSRALIERCRTAPLAEAEARALARVVIGVDPPASAGGTCGIVACGIDEAGRGHVLGDHSAAGLSPEGWARKAAGAAERWRAARVVAEANNGGRMVESVLKGARTGLPVRLVHAADSKIARAEPVAALFESGWAFFAGGFKELEDQLAAMVPGEKWSGPGRSPDRADAMVWAMTELMLGERRAEPRVRSL